MKSTHRSTHYQICLEGILDERWLRWFEGLEVKASADDQTTIRGEFDQSALHGLLNRIFDLGIPLISVRRLPANGSISMNLDGLQTRTPVTFDPGLAQDQLTLNCHPAGEDSR